MSFRAVYMRHYYYLYKCCPYDRVSRVVRPVVCACWPEVRSVRVALRTLRRALPAVAHVVLLYLAVLATAALMAYKMFGQKSAQIRLELEKCHCRFRF